MTSVSQPTILNLNKMTLEQTLADLENTQTFSCQWQDSKGNPVDCEEDDIAFAKFSPIELTKAQFKLVCFSGIQWQHLQQVQKWLKSNKVESLGYQIVKPTSELAGAFVIYLGSELSAAQKKEVVAFAENNDFEACYVANAPKLTEPGLIVMDMDSTAIQIECIDEIAKLAGVGDEVAKVTAAAMRGELDFAESLRGRVKTLTDAPIDIIDQVADNLPLMPGLESLVAVLKQNNWKVVIASGGFTYMTEVLKAQLGLDKTVANQLGMADSKLTGEVHGQIVDAQVKADTVVGLANDWGIEMSQTVAMGDGANDLVMMAAANLGMAFHAKPLVREEADASVRTGGLDQLLYLL